MRERGYNTPQSKNTSDAVKWETSLSITNERLGGERTQQKKSIDTRKHVELAV